MKFRGFPLMISILRRYNIYTRGSVSKFKSGVGELGVNLSISAKLPDFSLVRLFQEAIDKAGAGRPKAGT